MFEFSDLDFPKNLGFSKNIEIFRDFRDFSRFFKIMVLKSLVLRDQEDLRGLSQHCTIRLTCSHDSPDDSGANGQAQRHLSHPYPKNHTQRHVCPVYVPDYSGCTIYKGIPEAGHGSQWAPSGQVGLTHQDRCRARDAMGVSIFLRLGAAKLASLPELLHLIISFKL